MGEESVKNYHRVILMKAHEGKKRAEIEFSIPIRPPKKIKFHESLQLAKLNTHQIDKVVKALVTEIINPSILVTDDSLSELLDRSVNRIVHNLRRNIELNKRVLRYGHELWLAQKRALIDHITKNSFEPLHSSEVLKNHELNRFIKEYKKSITLEISQLKNSIKRAILWSKQKPRKVVSVIKTFIKFIITPRLFGIYVSEEDNNRVAVFSFSNY